MKPLPFTIAVVLLLALAAHAQTTTPATGTSPPAAPASQGDLLTVTDPYLELRTGPGRGYPVFFVAARGESLAITLRHTDWYKVRTAGGKEGWVQRAQLESTLTAAGEQRAFRDVLVDDYLKRRVEMGAAWGRFDGEPMLKIFGAYRLAETITTEVTVGQVQGLYSGTDYWQVNLHTEPWSDRRLSPTFGIGFGKFRNLPNTSLVGALPTDAKLANASMGLRWYLSARFVARADYTLTTAYIANAKAQEYRAFTGGLSFFF